MPNDAGHKTPTKSNSSRKDKAKQAVLERCCSEIDEAMVENGGRKPYGIVAEDVDLAIAQLHALLNMKKQKTDKSFSSFKKIDLCLWAEWKHRPNEAPQYDNELVESVHEATILEQSSDIEKETTVSDQGELRSISI